MRKDEKYSFNKMVALFLFFLFLLPVTSIQIKEINEDITGNINYSKLSFESDENTSEHFFKYSVKTIPKSQIGAFRIDFDQFNQLSLEKNLVFCTFVEESATDDDLQEALKNVDNQNTNCIGKFNQNGFFEGIIKYDPNKTKLGILLKANGKISFSATIYIQTSEQLLEETKEKEQKVVLNETYSLIPLTIDISKFRNSAQKILFYSYNKELQMYYIEKDTPYPEKLFSGNIMSVYTDINMIHQKYHDANYMVLLNRDFAEEEDKSSKFKFQVIFSNHLLDYYVSNNPNGRSKNSPLSINMTDCSDPYFIILNYNKPEKETSLYIDQIYGKIKSLNVATIFSSSTWEEMIENDMQDIKIWERKFVLPKESPTHMDVYKLECEIPLSLNFYYIDETADIPFLDYGQVVITTLKSYQSVSFQFNPKISQPELTIEIFNPWKSPLVYVDYGDYEFAIDKNYIFKTSPISNSSPIIKERAGDTSTRIIIKVGYNIGEWEKELDDVYYNSALNMHVYAFPNNDKKLNYTYVDLITTGAEDNVKFCYGANIGSAIIPSNENCYRVSKDNNYTLRFLNPFVMHKEYDISESLTYYVSIKPVSLTEEMKIRPELKSYSSNERNIEGLGKNINIDSSGKNSTILTPPKSKDLSVFVQVQNCNYTKTKISILNAYNNETILSETTINEKTKDFYKVFDNTFSDTELLIKGESDSNVFVRHSGIWNGYTADIKTSYSITFNDSLNQLEIENPFKLSEDITYTIFISNSSVLSQKNITLCSLIENRNLSPYKITLRSYYPKISVNVNFNKFGLKPGDDFEVLVIYEQQFSPNMIFLSDIFNGTVGEINKELITEIFCPYEEDKDFVYVKGNSSANEISYYFSYTPNETFEVPVGAFSIEFDSEEENRFSRVDCAFVDEDDDEVSMVEAIEDVITKYNSYCRKETFQTNKKRDNFLFTYSYKSGKPRKLVIKLSNENKYSGKFTIYIKKGENTFLQPTNFKEQKEYGEYEDNKKTVTPYIIDLEKIRNSNNSEIDYISKILIYSQNFEMQMNYIDETGVSNAPRDLFKGNIMLIYTNLDLAKEKYHSTKLILLCEKKKSENQSSIDNHFRFHTKMFKSDDPIEYFVKNNVVGMNLDNPINLQMNICTKEKNKYYYIINYDKNLNNIILYLDLIYGSMKNVKIASELSEEKWDDLIKNSMEEINDYQISLENKTHHIDVIEIECNTPSLANIYYNPNWENYYSLKNGDVVIKNLKPNEKVSLYLSSPSVNRFSYSISLSNSVENPNIRVIYPKIDEIIFNENSLYSGSLLSTPETITIINNGETPTRIVYKIGFGLESEWNAEKVNIKGNLFSKGNHFFYKFPIGDIQKNFTNVTINVKPMSKDSQEQPSSIKFCYSTSFGNPISSSNENCFRTGEKIPYSLTFINPLIFPKNYKLYSDNYYINLSPYNPLEFISLEIIENTYDVKERNIEGVANLIKLENSEQKRTILSMPDTVIDNSYILLQMQLCSSSESSIAYVLKNAYTKEKIEEGTLEKSNKYYTHLINYSLMETEVEFNGKNNDIIFTKHTSLNDYELKLQNYSANFYDNENVVFISVPILDEEFKINIFIGGKGKLKDYSLCNFVGIKESEYKDLPGVDYIKTIKTNSNNVINHFIDFPSIYYEEGVEFDLLVYAVQVNNEKLEILYEVINGVVGKINKQVESINDTFDDNYVHQSFIKKNLGNYLSYNFNNPPIGDIASLKISGPKIASIGCIFIKKDSDDDDILEVNKGIEEGRSCCIGEYNEDSKEFNALINTIDVKNEKTKLLIKIIYDMNDDQKDSTKLRDEEEMIDIYLRVNGYQIDNQNQEYNEQEEYTLIPYVLDLNDIRENNSGDYISKVLLFSKTYEMKIFYLVNNGIPVELFSGNILLIYTNPELVKEKYNNATTMILLTSSFSEPKKVFATDEFKFKAYFLKTKETYQYYVSPNPQGRLLNKPTNIEMPSCDQPYYYILNYNSFESDRILHLENIFGEINTIKIATEIKDNDWFDFINNMKLFEGNEYYIEKQTNCHFDVLEITCKTPLLTNIYYTDPSSQKQYNLEKNDITILTLEPGPMETLTFMPGQEGEFIYSFNILRTNHLSPNIMITFEEEENMKINEYGIYLKKTKENYSLIQLQNSGKDKEKIIFKFGYAIDKTFTKLENDIYHFKNENRNVNLYSYKFKNEEDRLNYSSVNFIVSTEESNVKFCYTTNLGSIIEPSLQNCYRVGKSNSYTLSILNPYIMHKDYFIGDDAIDYYISFKTTDINQNITIIPEINYYPTKNRNIEGYQKMIEGSTILTPPIGNEKYIFVQMENCIPENSIKYEFKNALNNEPLGPSGTIETKKSYTTNMETTNLDSLVIFEDIDKKERIPEVFIKHVGINEKYNPDIQEFKGYVDKNNGSKLHFNAPISGEEFNYTIYIDKKGYLDNKKYTLCSFTKLTKLAHYSEVFTSKEKSPAISIDFNNPVLKGYEEFDALVLADNGKLKILSNVFSGNANKKSHDEDDDDDNKNLAIIISVTIALIVIVLIITFLFLRYYKKKNSNVEEQMDKEKEMTLPMTEI